MAATTIFDRGRGHRVPIHLWARDASEETIAQLERIASRPYTALRVAAMADAHFAEGVAVGTVFATERVVVPRALGGDLGCGVSAMKLSLDASLLDRHSLDRIVAAFVRAIPAGDATHRGNAKSIAIPDALREGDLSTRSLEHTREALLPKHLGTLGGGNHFLEIDRDATGGTWLLVHSGSRGLGSAVAAHHVRAADALDSDPLAGIDTDRPEGKAYFADQSWALDVARANRAALSRKAMDVMSEVLGFDVSPTQATEEAIDIHHNYVAKERWDDDRDYFVHRKGAVAVPNGSAAIIPGSMATASYIVSGLGCPRAFGSCSHGAGRVMTRREARTRIDARALSRTMHRIAWPAHLAKRLVEEAPSAYRDIGEVLRDQSDLVTRQIRLEPIAVLKG